MNVLFDINRNEAMLHLAQHLQSVGKLSKALIVFTSYRERERLSSFDHDFDVIVRDEFYERAESHIQLNRVEKTSELHSIWQWIRGDRRLFQVTEKGKFLLDQCLLSHDSLLDIVRAVYHNIVGLFDEFRPDLVMLTDLHDLSKFVMAELAYKRRIPAMFLLPVRIGKYKAFSNTPYEHFKFIYQRHELLKKGAAHSNNLEAAKQYMSTVTGGLRQFHDAAQMSGWGPTEREQISATYLVRSCQSLAKARIRGILHRSEAEATPEGAFPTVPASTRFMEMLKVWMRRQYSIQKFRFDEPINGEQFVFFPLHSEPETAISLNASYIGNQAELVWNIATSIPIEMKLYVKDHPRMYGLRPVQYYDNMRRRNPNVRVLHPKLDALKILPDARLVVVIAGTAGLEACMHGIPVVALGACHFQYLSGVLPTRNLATLPQIINRALNNASNPDDVIEDTLLYLAACMDEGFPIRWYSDVVNYSSNYDYKCNAFKNFCNYVTQQIERVVKDQDWLQPLQTGYLLPETFGK